jgi:hypothetical protein
LQRLLVIVIVFVFVVPIVVLVVVRRVADRRFVVILVTGAGGDRANTGRHPGRRAGHRDGGDFDHAGGMRRFWPG